jgi:hypothetical protein
MLATVIGDPTNLTDAGVSRLSARFSLVSFVVRFLVET